MRRRDFLSSTLPIVGGILLLEYQHADAATVSRSILEFGAKPDGKTLNTSSIQHAIDAVSQAGGGTVVVPAGTFLSGLIELKSKVNLNLAEGSTLLGSSSIYDYKFASNPSAHNGPNPHHLIFAMNADDVTISGTGTIDGQGSSFWEPSDKASPAEDWAGVASHDLAPKKSGRPSPLLLFVNCRHLAVQDVHIQNSPGWTLHAINSDSVSIRGITIKNPVNGPNTDGIDITGCQNVTISNCSIETGDDAICLKSQNPFGPEPRLVKDVSITNCHLSTCCNGFKIGTETEGGFENITFSDSVVFNCEVPYKERVIAGVALEIVDGGWIDGVIVKNIKMQRSRTPIFIRLGNRKRVHDYPQHGIRNVDIDNVQASEALVPSSISGLPGMEIRSVTLSHMSLQDSLRGSSDLVKRPVPEKDTAYPESRMFGMLPASGLYVRHVRDLHLNEVTFTAPSGESRPTLVFDDVVGARLSEIRSSPISGRMPVLLQNNSSDVQILKKAG
ncbi:glycoside hydrolase family 28 protein [Occallatibacter savannae]|uniref:glycoside hydrolase family 28 protein n=1 Tax=Occallatibacter savannae TaxID=1002691 RepID=UPI000D697C2D|nr:glycoside hydrolase family 28 protein [Occallatibacter savannae]